MAPLKTYSRNSTLQKSRLDIIHSVFKKDKSRKKNNRKKTKIKIQELPPPPPANNISNTSLKVKINNFETTFDQLLKDDNCNAVTFKPALRNNISNSYVSVNSSERIDIVSYVHSPIFKRTRKRCRNLLDTCDNESLIQPVGRERTLDKSVSLSLEIENVRKVKANSCTSLSLDLSSLPKIRDNNMTRELNESMFSKTFKEKYGHMKNFTSLVISSTPVALLDSGKVVNDTISPIVDKTASIIAPMALNDITNLGVPFATPKVIEKRVRKKRKLRKIDDSSPNDLHSGVDRGLFDTDSNVAHVSSSHSKKGEHTEPFNNTPKMKTNFHSVNVSPELSDNNYTPELQTEQSESKVCISDYSEEVSHIPMKVCISAGNSSKKTYLENTESDLTGQNFNGNGNINQSARQINQDTMEYESQQIVNESKVCLNDTNVSSHCDSNVPCPDDCNTHLDHVTQKSTFAESSSQISYTPIGITTKDEDLNDETDVLQDNRQHKLAIPKFSVHELSHSYTQTSKESYSSASVFTQENTESIAIAPESIIDKTPYVDITRYVFNINNLSSLTNCIQELTDNNNRISQFSHSTPHKPIATEIIDCPSYQSKLSRIKNNSASLFSEVSMSCGNAIDQTDVSSIQNQECSAEFSGNQSCVSSTSCASNSRASTERELTRESEKNTKPKHNYLTRSKNIRSKFLPRTFQEYTDGGSEIMSSFDWTTESSYATPDTAFQSQQNKPTKRISADEIYSIENPTESDIDSACTAMNENRPSQSTTDLNVTTEVSKLAKIPCVDVTNISLGQFYKQSTIDQSSFVNESVAKEEFDKDLEPGSKFLPRTFQEYTDGGSEIMSSFDWTTESSDATPDTAFQSQQNKPTKRISADEIYSIENPTESDIDSACTAMNENRPSQSTTDLNVTTEVSKLAKIPCVDVTNISLGQFYKQSTIDQSSFVNESVAKEEFDKDLEPGTFTKIANVSVGNITTHNLVIENSLSIALEPFECEAEQLKHANIGTERRNFVHSTPRKGKLSNQSALQFAPNGKKNDSSASFRTTTTSSDDTEQNEAVDRVVSSSCEADCKKLSRKRTNAKSNVRDTEPKHNYLTRSKQARPSCYITLRRRKVPVIQPEETKKKQNKSTKTKRCNETGSDLKGSQGSGSMNEKENLKVHTAVDKEENSVTHKDKTVKLNTVLEKSSEIHINDSDLLPIVTKGQLSLSNRDEIHFVMDLSNRISASYLKNNTNEKAMAGLSNLKPYSKTCYEDVIDRRKSVSDLNNYASIDLQKRHYRSVDTSLKSNRTRSLPGNNKSETASSVADTSILSNMNLLSQTITEPNQSTNIQNQTSDTSEEFCGFDLDSTSITDEVCKTVSNRLRTLQKVNMHMPKIFEINETNEIDCKYENSVSNLPEDQGKPSLVLKPGKLWRRSLIEIRNSTVGHCVKGRKTSICVTHRGCICTCTKCKQKSLETTASRRLSIRVIPLSPSRTPSKNVSVLGNYAANMCKSYISNALQDDLLEEYLENLSLTRDTLGLTLQEPNCIPAFTARDVVLRRCGQIEPIPFEKCFPKSMLQNCHKIGEGVYGEVFLFRNQNGGTSVMKVIPIEGNLIVNGERQKKFDEILSEIVIALELSNLRKSKKNYTTGFSEVQKISCVKGKYPERLLELWDLFDEDRGSENDSPVIFEEDQLYVVLELANGGRDLEAFVFNNAQQAHALFIQTACALAVAESSLQFEHRDLHWGNILITNVEQNKKVSYYLDGKKIELPTNGVEVSIIDFTLSRITHDGVCIYNDLSLDPDLFTAKGDYQFDIYRLMQKCNGNEWGRFEPYTNVLWLHYTLDKMITALRYKNKNSKVHKEYIKKLKELKEEILQYKSVEEIVNCKFMENL